MKRIRKSHVLAVLFAAALCVPASGASKGSGLPTKIGKGEGSLSLIEWPGYSDKSFATKFVRQTGCKIHRKDAGTSNDMVALMRTGGGGGGGQYDLVSASGDASLRLIRGGDVQPVNINLIPSRKNFTLPRLDAAMVFLPKPCCRGCPKQSITAMTVLLRCWPKHRRPWRSLARE